MQRLVIGHRWGSGAHVKGDAAEAAKQFEALRSIHDGTLPLTAVIDANREPAAPLHHDFEWHDPLAAHLYRLEQAGYLVRSHRTLTVDTRTEEPLPPERSYIPLQSVTPSSAPVPAASHVYVPVAMASTEDQQTEQLRQRAFGRLQRLADELRSLGACADIAEAIDDLLERWV